MIEQWRDRLQNSRNFVDIALIDAGLDLCAEIQRLRKLLRDAAQAAMTPPAPSRERSERNRRGRGPVPLVPIDGGAVTTREVPGPIEKWRALRCQSRNPADAAMGLEDCVREVLRVQGYYEDLVQRLTRVAQRWERNGKEGHMPPQSRRTVLLQCARELREELGR